jgi:hypothetical protein
MLLVSLEATAQEVAERKHWKHKLAVDAGLKRKKRHLRTDTAVRNKY